MSLVQLKLTTLFNKYNHCKQTNLRHRSGGHVEAVSGRPLAAHCALVWNHIVNECSVWRENKSISANHSDTSHVHTTLMLGSNCHNMACSWLVTAMPYYRSDQLFQFSVLLFSIFCSLLFYYFIFRSSMLSHYIRLQCSHMFNYRTLFRVDILYPFIPLSVWNCCYS